VLYKAVFPGTAPIVSTPAFDSMLVVGITLIPQRTILAEVHREFAAWLAGSGVQYPKSGHWATVIPAPPRLDPGATD